MKTAAVLGASSMLGRELGRQLRAQGVGVIGIGRDTQHEITLDLGRPLDPQAGLGMRADVLFHFASAFAGDDPGGLRENLTINVLGCINVLVLMDRLGCSHVVYAGSVSSIEGFDPAGRSSYGLSKAMAEQTLQWGVRRRDGRFCSVRLAQLYDTEGECCRHQAWFGRIVAYASRGLVLRLPPSEGVRNFLHVSDAATLLLRAASADLAGTWAACHDESLTLAQIAELAYAEFDLGGEVVIDDAKSPVRCVNFPDSAELFDRLGQRPSIRMAEGLTRIHRAGTAERFGPLDVQ